jgi:hypothetical protein
MGNANLFRESGAENSKRIVGTDAAGVSAVIASWEHCGTTATTNLSGPSQRRLSALSVLHTKFRSSPHGAFVWARRAPSGPKMAVSGAGVYDHNISSVGLVG